MAISLDHLKNGIVDFIQRETDKQYKEFVNEVTAKAQIKTFECNQCSHDNVVPEHSTVKGRLCKLKHCHCIQNRLRRKCPNGNACGIFYDLICDQHTKKAPNFTNTNIDKWSTSSFEYIKCFIPTPGYKSKCSFDDLDLLALLNICQNNERLKKHFDSPDIHSTIERVSCLICFI